MEGGEKKRRRSMEAGTRRGNGDAATRDEGKSKITEVRVTCQEIREK